MTQNPKKQLKTKKIPIKRKYKKLYILKNDMTLEDCLLEDNINLELKIEVD